MCGMSANEATLYPSKNFKKGNHYRSRYGLQYGSLSCTKQSYVALTVLSGELNLFTYTFLIRITGSARCLMVFSMQLNISQKMFIHLCNFLLCRQNLTNF